MQLNALAHRADSEMAYLDETGALVVRLQTAKLDIARVMIYFGDPYARQTTDPEAWAYSKRALSPTLTTGCHQYWEIRLPAIYNRIQYAFWLTDKAGETAFFDGAGALLCPQPKLTETTDYFRLPYRHMIDAVQTPQWVSETVWYQIFPDRFKNGDTRNDPKGVLPWAAGKKPGRQDFFGGDLQGILDELPYLHDLGINGLYLTPIFLAPSNHKYDTTDYRQIDPHFGDEALFVQLVNKAHQLGMKVMLDAVFNHIGATSPQWQDVLRHQEASKYKDWFHIHQFPVTYEATADFEVAKDLSYETFAFAPQMPKWNTANPEVQDFLLAAVRHWQQLAPIDAWRLDVADEVDHHFWRRFRGTLKALNPEIYLLGEVWYDATPWLNGLEFDGVMNYPLMRLIQAHFFEKRSTNQTFIEAVNGRLLHYRNQTNAVLFNLLGSHDTPRLMTQANGSLISVEAALAFLFFQKGTPCLYYGDEVGVLGR